MTFYMVSQGVMEHPLGFVNEDFLNHVCWLNHSLYGLKQTPRAWFDTVSQFLLYMGFCCGKVELSLFIQTHMSLYYSNIIYVDDVIITKNDTTTIDNLIHTLSKEFSLKDLG